MFYFFDTSSLSIMQKLSQREYQNDNNKWECLLHGLQHDFDCCGCSNSVEQLAYGTLNFRNFLCLSIKNVGTQMRFRDGHTGINVDLLNCFILFKNHAKIRVVLPKLWEGYGATYALIRKLFLTMFAGMLCCLLFDNCLSFRSPVNLLLLRISTCQYLQYFASRAAYYRGAMGILLVYDVTDESSFNSKFHQFKEMLGVGLFNLDLELFFCFLDECWSCKPRVGLVVRVQ